MVRFRVGIIVFLVLYFIFFLDISLSRMVNLVAPDCSLDTDTEMAKE